MKKFYTLFVAVATAFTLNAQTSAVSACKLNATGGFRIIYDDNKSCKAELKTLAKIGFHSGIDGWNSVVSAEKDGFQAGVAKGNGIFWVDVTDPKKYYGVTALPKELNFVFNQYPADNAMPWGKEGKAKAADGTCADFKVDYTTLASCSVNTADLLLDIKTTLSPNPMQNQSILTIENGKELYSVEITSINGQLIRKYENVSSSLLIEKNDLNAGLYFLVIKNKENKFTTQKLVVE